MALPTPTGGTARPTIPLLVLAFVLACVAGQESAVAQEQAGWRLSEEASRDWILDSWGIEDGLPQSSVNDIVQTRDGYLWLATFGGLTRFDGARFHTFNPVATPGLAGTRVTTLFEDSRGVLWIGFEEAGIARRMPDGRFETVPAPPERTVATVWETAEDASGTIWFATSDAFLTYTDSNGLRVADAPIRAPRGIPSVHARGDDIWLGMGEAPELVRYRVADNPREFSVDLLQTPGRSPYVFEDSSGRFWLGTNRGAAIADTDGSFTLVPGSNANNQAMVEDANGTLWLLGSRTLTLQTTDTAPGSEHFTIAEPLGTLTPNETRVGLNDREGNLWIGTLGGGLLRLRPRPLAHFTRRGATDNNVGALAITADGRIWASVGCGEVVTLDAGGFRTVESLSGSGFCQNALAVDGEDALMISHPSGLLRYRNGSAEVVAPAPVDLVTVGADGHVWVTSSREIRLWDGTSVVTVHSLAPDGDSLPFGVAHGGVAGTLWLGGRDRLVRWNGDSLQRFGPSDGLLPGQIRALQEDEEGVLWIGSYGGGLARFDGTDFVRYTMDVGLAENHALQILEDDAGNLWINGNRSLSYVSRNALNSFARDEIDHIEPVSFGPADGFVEGNSSQHGALRSPDGRLWFSTIDGVLVVDPANRAANIMSTPVAIEEISTADSAYEISEEVILPPRTRNIQFRYTALSLRRPGHIRFRYRLEGYDEDWVNAGIRRDAFYTSVPPGSYRFQVRASNDEGVWNETGASISLVVLPSFWVTWWFRILAALGLSCLGYALYRARTRAIRQHAVELQSRIDERERSESRQRALEEQLRQSQKLEAIGQLTGGVAHDFNNLLTVIAGNLELASEHDNEPGAQAAIGHALDATARGAALTQRLLAFSRKQPLRPESLDVRNLIAGMDDLLRRTLGEQIDIETVGAGGLWRCEADPTQLESAILNLAINARDAMPQGGKLTLEVGNVRLDAGYADLHNDIEAGQYVMVTVTDTGTGMPLDVIDRAFDPFFTTKGVGRGSGLGLSMVYGFTRQSGGHARIYSEPGEGTTVKLYLPRSRSGSSTPQPAIARQSPASGSNELILVVEDDAPVRRITVALLRGLGYRTIEAATVADALDRLEAEPEVRLLLTDVVLERGETGADLAREVNRRRPDIPVLFTSGYTENAFVHHGRLDAGVDLLEKPFTREQLARRVHEAITGVRG